MSADSSFSAVPSPSDGSSSAAQPTAGQPSAAWQSAQQQGVLRPPASALLLLAVLVATFGLLRWTANPAPHSGGDNAAYVALGHALATGQGYVESWDPSLAPHTKYPPVWPSALAAAQRLGADSWQALKGVTTLFALLAAAATWLFAVARVGPWAATGAALATVTSFSFLDHSAWLLSDVPFVALLMLALWAGDRALRDEAPALGWVMAAGVLAALVVLTRSAGLPVVAALIASLALARRAPVRRFSAALVAGVLSGVPLLMWFFRGRGVAQEGAYGREFWLLDPYRPELGEIGLAALPARALDNLGRYLTDWLPATIGGPDAGVFGLVVWGVLIAALPGWWRALRTRVRPAELFAPLYVGLVLVWPSVWGGDRFALPLIPLLLVWALDRLQAATRERPVLQRRLAAAVVAGLLLLPLSAGARTASASARACRVAVEAAGPWACAGRGMLEFTEAARWAGARLPEGSVTLTRKPRIWHAMSGQATRTYPFTTDGDTLLAVADRVGARYVVLDLLSAQAQGLAEAIGARLEAYCSVAGFGGADGGPRTELLGILPPAARQAAAESGMAGRIARCPDAYLRQDAAAAGSTSTAPPTASGALPPYRAGSPIPLLSSGS